MHLKQRRAVGHEALEYPQMRLRYGLQKMVELVQLIMIRRVICKESVYGCLDL